MGMAGSEAKEHTCFYQTSRAASRCLPFGLTDGLMQRSKWLARSLAMKSSAQVLNDSIVNPNCNHKIYTGPRETEVCEFCFVSPKMIYLLLSDWS